MAYYNPQEHAFEEKCKEAYDELISKLKTSKELKDSLAYSHIYDLEQKIASMEKELETYKGFFCQLKSLIPSDFTNNIIG